MNPQDKIHNPPQTTQATPAEKMNQIANSMPPGLMPPTSGIKADPPQGYTAKKDGVIVDSQERIREKEHLFHQQPVDGIKKGALSAINRHPKPFAESSISGTILPELSVKAKKSPPRFNPGPIPPHVADKTHVEPNPKVREIRK